MDDFKCSRVKEQDASFEAERKGPLRLFLENEMRKAGGGLFLPSSRVVMTLSLGDALKIKIHPKTLMLLHLYV